MKKLFFIFLTAFFTMLISTSCQNDLNSDIMSNAEELSAEYKSKTLLSDTLIVDELPLEETEELKEFQRRIEEIQKTRAMTYGPYDDNYDANLWNNMWAIREMPITFQARGGGNTGNKFLSTNGKRQEITLVGSVSNDRQKFFIKVLPSTSGIPYLIYSKQESTPLLVGQKANDPNRKTLMPWDKDEILFGCSWDLIPASTPGYFAIQSQSYLGQADPNNPWTVFYHIVEVKNNNIVGYARYTNSAAQEFLLKPLDAIYLSSITYDASSATISEGRDITIVSTSRNTSIEEQPYTIPVNKLDYEESYFSQNRSSIDFDIANSNIRFQRPTVEAKRIVLPKPETPRDATYKTTNFLKLYKLLSFKIEGNAPENSLIEVTTYIKTYNVSIKYTVNAYVYYGGIKRDIIFTGTWRGKVILSPEHTKPTHIPRYFDLDTGEEIFGFSRSSIRTTFNK